MGYNRTIGREFWYDFDNQTLWKRTPEAKKAIGIVYGPYANSPSPLDGLPNLFRASFSSADHPRIFRDGLQDTAAGVRALAEIQTRIMRAHFGASLDGLAEAFIDFGQGVLYDDRAPRPPQRFVHTMDGRPMDWAGYHRWHAFAAAALESGGVEADWRTIKSYIALAWAIQTEADPPIADNNPGLPSQRIDVLRQFWLGTTSDFIDNAFALNLNGAPRAESFRTTSAGAALDERPGYARVAAILDAAAGDGFPRHGRFWKSPLAEFIAHVVDGRVAIIAEPGPNRGARSNLIHALKGEGLFGDDGDYPRMPYERPPVSPENIALIEAWIDMDCPP